MSNVHFMLIKYTLSLRALAFLLMNKKNHKFSVNCDFLHIFDFDSYEAAMLFITERFFASKMSNVGKCEWNVALNWLTVLLSRSDWKHQHM